MSGLEELIDAALSENKVATLCAEAAIAKGSTLFTPELWLRELLEERERLLRMKEHVDNAPKVLKFRVPERTL